MFVFAFVAAGCISAQLQEWQQRYFDGMRALQQRRTAEARTILQAAYDYARSHPVEREWVARTSFGLGCLAQVEADPRTAERFHSEARTILEERAERQPIFGLVLNGLGEALIEQLRFDEAQKVLSEAVVIFDRDYNRRFAGLLSRRHIAEIRLLQDDYAGAEEMLRTIVAQEKKEREAPDLASALRILGRVYTMEQRWKEAEDTLREAMDRDGAEKQPTLQLADTLVALAALYRVQGLIARAEPLLRKAINAYESHNDPRASGAYHQLGLCRLAENKQATARELFTKAFEIASKAAMPEQLLRKLKDDLDITDLSVAAARTRQP